MRRLIPIEKSPEQAACMYETKNTRFEDPEMLGFDFKAPYFQALYNAPIPMTIAREDGRLLMLNRTFQEATGYSLEMIATDDDWIDLFEGPTEDSRRRLAVYLDPEKTLMPLRTKSGQLRIWEICNAPLGRMADGQRVIISIALDVTEKIECQRHMEGLAQRLEQEVRNRTQVLNRTIQALEDEIEERKRMSEALTLSRDRLKNLTVRTLSILEADRQSISKELHDRLGASLAAIKFSLEDKEIKRSQTRGRLEESLKQDISDLLTTIKETKRISADLRPTTLDDLGLMATVRWYLRHFQRVYRGVAVDYTVDICEEDVPDEMKIIIYRIIQEGLSNVEKHGDASMVCLHLAFADGKRSISLYIQDDGRGFDVQKTLSRNDPLNGYGLTAMRERCEILGGSFHVDSRIGRGTKIEAILPL